MSKRNCAACLFGDHCRSNSVCEHYSPVDEEMTDAELERYIEKGRKDYLREWWRYTGDIREEEFFFRTSI